MNNNEEFEGRYADDGVYYAKGTFENEVEYNNEIICLVNYTDEYFNAIAKALNEKQYEQVDQAFDDFEAQNVAALQGLKDLGSYHGDDSLLNIATKYISELTAILKTDYRALTIIIKEEVCTKQEYAAQRDKFSMRMQNITQMLSDGIEAFSNKYEEVEEEDDFSSLEGFGDMFPGMEHVDFDHENPLLQPVHGISLEDYAAATSKMASGMNEDEVAKALGVERPQWDEANQMWQLRMQQDTQMKVIGLFGQYFATADQHPKFQNLSQDSSAPINQENLARIKEDPEFYFELTGAMQAAYNQGMDGAQWLRETHGLSLGEFQTVAMQWASSPIYAAMIPFIGEKTKEYEAKFARESGGNIADDITF